MSNHIEPRVTIITQYKVSKCEMPEVISGAVCYLHLLARYIMILDILLLIFLRY